MAQLAFRNALGRIGINGIAKTLIGYIGASIGLRVDVEALTTRIVMIFVFSLLNSLLLYLIMRRLLGLETHELLWRHELLRAGVNTAVAVPLFFLMAQQPWWLYLISLAALIALSSWSATIAATRSSSGCAMPACRAGRRTGSAR